MIEFIQPASAADLKAARAKLGWTQAKFAAELGITASHVSQMEAGKRPVDRRMGLAVAYLQMVDQGLSVQFRDGRPSVAQSR